LADTPEILVVALDRDASAPLEIWRWLWPATPAPAPADAVHEGALPNAVVPA
jgi:hypothetical protein